MFEYVLVIYLTSMNNPQYEGHFESCAKANIYMMENYPEAVYSSCLHEDYIFLPKNLNRREINVY